MFMTHHQNAGKNHNLMIANKSYENVVKFKYLEMSLTTQDCIHEESKIRLNSGNASETFIFLFPI